MSRRGKHRNYLELLYHGDISHIDGFSEEMHQRVIEWQKYLEWAGERQQRTRKRPPSFDRWKRLVDRGLA